MIQVNGQNVSVPTYPITEQHKHLAVNHMYRFL